jgi:biotin operon repressor
VSREKAAFVLSTYESQPDELLSKKLNPSAKLIRKRAPVLQRLGYNVFSEPQARGSLPPLSALSPVTSTTSSGIDTITALGITQQNRSIVIPQEASFIQLTGWAIDANNESTAGGVYVDVNGKLFPAFYGTDRQNVADSFGVPSYRYSGFERAIPVSEIGAGTHELAILVLTTDKKGYYQPDQKVVLEVR